MIYLFYWCNWLIIEILFTFVLNLIWLYCIFIKIEILLKLGPQTGPFDPWGPRGGGRPIYLVCVRSGMDWPDPLSIQAGLTRDGSARLPTRTDACVNIKINKNNWLTSFLFFEESTDSRLWWTSNLYKKWFFCLQRYNSWCNNKTTLDTQRKNNQKIPNACVNII